MKLHRVVMRAFGPYAEEQVIDFTCLDKRSFLLVHGPIGAGKSTILDAICFAFYGQTSGTERDGRQMRSQHASPQTPTEVTVDFALGLERYRVRRSPMQTMPKRRGEGTREVAAEATLFRRTDVPDDSDGEVVATRSDAVTQEMIRRLGFKNDQFRQVVVLPQGQFRRLLMAKSDEREEILEALFQTHVYSRIEEALKDAARELDAQSTRVKTHRKVILDEAGVETPEILSARRVELAAAEAEAETATVEAEANRKAAAEVLEKARAADACLTELEKARAESMSLEGRVPLFEAKAQALALAQRADRVASAHEESVRADEGAKEATRKLAAATAALATAKAAHEKAAHALQAEQARGAERSAASETCTRLGQLKPKIEALATAQGDLTQAVKAAVKAQGQQEQATRDLAAAEKELTDLQQALQHEQRHAEQADGARLRRMDLERRCTSLQDLVKVEASLARAREGAGKSLAAETVHQRHIDEAREQLARLLSAEREGRAARLARDLKPGHPCAVCGSTEHPAPARADGIVPGDDELEAAQSALTGLEKALPRLVKARETAQAEVSTLEGRRQTLADAVGQDVASSLPDLENQLAGAVKAEREADQATKSLPRLEQGAGEAIRRVDALRTALDTAVAEAQAVRLAEAEARARKTELENDVPSGLRTSAAHAAALKKAEATRDELQSRLDDVVTSSAETATILAGVEATRKAADEAAAVAARDAEARTATLERRLEEEQFADLAAFQAARREPRAQQSLVRELEQFKDARAAATARLERAQAAAASQAPCDLQAAQDAAAEAEEAWKAAVRRHSEATTERGRVEGWLQRLSDLAGEMALIDARYAVAGCLAEVANGQNGKKMSFQRFVLAALLDDVLLAASERLDTMTRGRYALRRVEGSGDQRRAGGLDLEVADTWTGQCRPVATLSGGEGFLASLALALALADVVQAYAGGIRLDTVFVDEGFGSLDPESLDLALRALYDLQSSGRLVGLISHVPEMRERIDTRLEISTGPRGSTARFVLD